MKIGIVGSQGVGKTTIAKLLAQKIQLAYIEEQIRLAVNQFNDLGYCTPDDIVGTKWYPHFMLDIYIKQIRIEHSCSKGFISDRTTLDYFAYYEILNHDETFITEMFRNLYINYYETQYDLIIYVPIRFPLSSDNYRNIDESFQRKADENIQKWLSFNKHVYILQALSVEERIEEIIKILSSKIHISQN